MICPACKTENAPGATFCSRCGVNLSGAGTTAGSAETPGGVPYTTVPGSSYAGGTGSASAGAPDSTYAGGPAAGGTGSTYTGAPGPAALPGARPAGLSDNAAAAISYVTIIPAIVFLVIEPYNRIPFVRFHSFQSILLFAATVVAHIICGLIPVVGWIIAPLVSIAFLVVWVICLLKASKGEWYKLPVIGNLAEQQARRAL